MDGGEMTVENLLALSKHQLMISKILLVSSMILQGIMLGSIIMQGIMQCIIQPVNAIESINVIRKDSAVLEFKNLLNFALRQEGSDYFHPLWHFLLKTRDLAAIALHDGLEKCIQEDRWEIASLLVKKASFKTLTTIIHSLLRKRSSKLLQILDALKQNHNFNQVLIYVLIKSADDKEGILFLVNELLASSREKYKKDGFMTMIKAGSWLKGASKYPLDAESWNAFILAGQSLFDQVLRDSDLDKSRLEKLKKIQVILKEDPNLKGPFFFGIMLLNTDFGILEILIQRLTLGSGAPLDFDPIRPSKSSLSGSGRNVFKFWEDLCAMNAIDPDNPFFNYVMEKDEYLRSNYLFQNCKYALEVPGFAQAVSHLILQIPKKADTILQDMKLQLLHGDLSFVEHLSQDYEILDLIPMAIETAAKRSLWNQVFLLSEFDPKTAIKVSESKPFLIERILASATENTFSDLLDYVFSLALEEGNMDIVNTFYRF